MKLNFEGLSINAVLVFGAVAGAVYLYWKAKSGLVNVADSVTNALTVPKPTAQNPQIKGYDKSHDAAMAKLGLDIKKYSVWFPNPLTPLMKPPSGSIRVTWGAEKQFYTIYAPNAGGANLSIFTL